MFLTYTFTYIQKALQILSHRTDTYFDMFINTKTAACVHLCFYPNVHYHKCINKCNFSFFCASCGSDMRFRYLSLSSHFPYLYSLTFPAILSNMSFLITIKAFHTITSLLSMIITLKGFSVKRSMCLNLFL